MPRHSFWQTCAGHDILRKNELADSRSIGKDGYMDALYILGAVFIVLGAVLIIVGYCLRKKHKTLGWTFMLLGLALLIAAVIVINTHFNHVKAATALVRLAL